MLFEILKKIKKHLFLFLVGEIILALILSTQIKIPKNILETLIIPVVYLMLIPSMMNINLKDVFSIKKYKLVLAALAINFIIFPLVSYVIYMLTNNFDLFIGLLLISLLPTSSMTMNFVHMLHGNIHTTAVIQILCLTIGSLLVSIIFPIILSNANINISFYTLIYKVFIIIFVPLIIGQILRYLIGKHKIKENKEKLKLTGMLGMILIIFISTLLKSQFILTHIKEITINVMYILIFYLIAIAIAYLCKSLFEDKRDWISFLYSITLKNISTALGLSIILFPNVVIYLVIAYLIQSPLATILMHRIEKNK